MILRDSLARQSLGRGFTGSVLLKEHLQEKSVRGEGSRTEQGKELGEDVVFARVPWGAREGEWYHSVASDPEAIGGPFVFLYQPGIGCGLSWGTG